MAPKITLAQRAWWYLHPGRCSKCDCPKGEGKICGNCEFPYISPFWRVLAWADIAAVVGVAIANAARLFA